MDARTERHDQRANVVAAENLVDARLLNVEQLAAQREDRLEASIATLLRRTTGRLTLHDVELRLGWVALLAVGELARECAPLKRALAHDELFRLARRFASTRRIERLTNHLFTIRRILFKELRQALVDGGLHDPLDLGGAELRLCLAFKLRIDKFHADHCSEAFAHIFAGEVWIVVFHRTVLAAPVIQRAGECGAESGDVRSTVNGVDVVRKGKECLGP